MGIEYEVKAVLDERLIPMNPNRAQQTFSKFPDLKKAEVYSRRLLDHEGVGSLVISEVSNGKVLRRWDVNKKGKELIPIILIAVAFSLTGCELISTTLETTTVSSAKSNESDCRDWEGVHLDWYDNQPAQGNYLDLNSDCTGSDTFCQYEFTYTLPEGDGTTFVTLTNSNLAAGCLTEYNRAYECTFVMSDQYTLNVDCGVEGWSATYAK